MHRMVTCDSAWSSSEVEDAGKSDVPTVPTILSLALD